MNIGKTDSTLRTTNEPTDNRLLVMSNNSSAIRLLSNAIRNNVQQVVYKYEKSSMDDLLASIVGELGGEKVVSIAFILDGNTTEIYLAGVGKVVLSLEKLADQQVEEFFYCVSSTFMINLKNEMRIDFLNSSLKNPNDILKISQHLSKITNCPVGIFNDLYGSDLGYAGDRKSRTVGELYFYAEKLEELLNLSLQSETPHLAGYELIRTVGKGAFGTAMLYRKKANDTFVIFKKINMHDLTASERQLAINEVRVLAMLNHENIVSYYDSFEHDGILMIEMEYADGGSLAQYLSELKASLEEREVLLMFRQIASAIRHMHEHNILHRDLKTANIFLTKEGTVKVGDFGISKILTTRRGGAMTIVGTPYYISPEMCEGKLYNEKSDIWALGCILYEIACQQKTFEGSNLPALVNKIVKGQFAPVKGNYSPAFRQLIRQLLQKDPDFRPTAKEILEVKLPELLQVYDDPPLQEYGDAEISMEYNTHMDPTVARNSLKQPLRSVLYDVKIYQEDISLLPIPLPPRIKIKDMAVSSTHMIVLTSEFMVFTWGDGRKGQLGHGRLETWRERPHCVEALKTKNINRICAGEGFSIFASDNGIIMTCGNGSDGCLGHGDRSMCIKPKLVEKLLSVDVSNISCGPHHVVVVGSEGEAYAWGCGAGGRLGTGSEEDCCSPTEVQFMSDVRVMRSYCGHDGTMYITETGSLLACGKNDFNKLGLNEHKGFISHMKQLLSKTEIEIQLNPVRLSWLKQHVVSVSMGIHHTAVLIEPGKIITLGYNKNGELGRGNQRCYSAPSVVKTLEDHTITMVQCGNTFTIAGTVENAVLFWGSRQVLAPNHIKSKLEKRKNDTSKNDLETSESSISEVIKIGESNSPLMREIERVGPDSPIIQVKTPGSDSPISRQRSLTNSSQEDEANNYFFDSYTGRKDVVLQPQEILALYASSAQVTRGEIVKLMNLFCFGIQVYLAVDTTAPLPQNLDKKKHDIPPLNNNHHKKLDFQKYDVSSESSFGTVPEWLQKEFINGIPMPNATVPDVLQNKGNLQNKVKSEKSSIKTREDNMLKIQLEKLLVEKKDTDEKLKQLEKRLEEVTLNTNEKRMEEEIALLKEQLGRQLTPHNRNDNEQRVLHSAEYQQAWNNTKKVKHRSRICNVQ